MEYIELYILLITIIIIYIYIHYIAKSILMQGLSALVISMSVNLNVSAYNDILGNLML